MKITNGTTVREVTKGAYKTMYAPFGYYPYDEVVEDKNIVANVEANEAVCNDDIDLLEKPLNDMSIDELKQYAKIAGINIGEFKKKKEIKEAIVKSLNK